ncbi:MAG: alpha/beta fold hydrolase [Pseudomonadota bacterium]
MASVEDTFETGRLGVQAMENRKDTDAKAIPIILLHGFGGFAAQWRPLQLRLSTHAPTMAFDLPGHGESMNYPGFGPPKRAAEAVLAEMKARSIDKAVVVGHSMGGAVASLMALLEPSRIERLVLLAPGGFGEAFNHDHLMKWAAAREESELARIMPTFFAPGFDLPAKAITLQANLRAKPGLVEALVKIGASMAKDGKQGVLPLEAMAKTGVPIHVLWGTKDAILPVEQAEALSAPFAVTLLEGVGHSPAEYSPAEVERAILGQSPSDNG